MTIVRLRAEEKLDRSTMMTSPKADNEGDIDRPSTMTASVEVDDNDDVNASTMTATSPETDRDDVDVDRSVTVTSSPALGGGSTLEALRASNSASRSRHVKTFLHRLFPMTFG